MSDLLHVVATGDVVVQTKKASAFSVTLTPAAALSTVTVRTGGAAGTIKLVLQAAAAGNSVEWVAGEGTGAVLFTDGIHVTLTGAGASVDVEFEMDS